MGKKYLLYFRSPRGLMKSSRLSEIFVPWQKANEHWLFITAHDDDAIIGSGLLLQVAQAYGVAVTVLVTTDGSMGYCNLSQRENITSIRKRETILAFAELGVLNIQWLNFPDDNLMHYLGRRRALIGDPNVIEGYTGMENAYTYWLRKLLPSRIFVASASDLHLDHKAVYHELLISLVHATSCIWPELGNPCPSLPIVYEMALYGSLLAKPDLKLVAHGILFDRKVKAIQTYSSQQQIDFLVGKVQKEGAVEYYQTVSQESCFPIYNKLF